MTKRNLFLILPLLFAAALMAQTASPGTTVPQGAAIPGIGAPEGPNGPGYIEFGGSPSELTPPNPHWTDEYLRGVINVSPSNAVSIETDHQARFGDSGYFGSIGLAHSFT